MDSQDLGHDRPDKASKVKDDANSQRSQGHRENREVDRTTIGQNYHSLSGTAFASGASSLRKLLKKRAGSRLLLRRSADEQLQQRLPLWRWRFLGPSLTRTSDRNRSRICELTITTNLVFTFT